MRMPRISIQNALYYVTSRGDNEENIFKDAVDYNTYLDLIKKNKNQCGFKLFAYCLLPNHLHLLIELTQNSNISQIMCNLNSNYTKYFNKKHSKQGHLFQERYKLILMEKARYLADMTAYIHLNPLVTSACKDYENYAYSSCPLYLGKENALIDIKKEKEEVLNYLPVKNYAAFISDFYQNKSKIISEEINRKTILGTDEFVDKVKAEMENSRLQDEKPEQTSASANKRFIHIGIAAILILVVVSAFLYINTLQMKKSVKQQIVNKEKEVGAKIEQEKENIIRSFDEKHRADAISYQVMQKRLEAENSKTEELGKKLKGIKK